MEAELETVHYEREGFTTFVTWTASREFYRAAIFKDGHLLSVTSGSGPSPKDEEEMVARARRTFESFVSLEYRRAEAKPKEGGDGS